MFIAVQREFRRRLQHAQADMFLEHVVSAFVIICFSFPSFSFLVRSCSTTYQLPLLQFHSIKWAVRSGSCRRCSLISFPLSFGFFRTSVLVISAQFQKSVFCGLTPVYLSQTKYMVFFFGKDCILHFAEQFKNCDCWRVCQTMHSMIFFSLVWWTRATTLMGQ
jgi:hypothetical protein